MRSAANPNGIVMIRTKQIKRRKQIAQRQPEAAEDQPYDVQDQAHLTSSGRPSLPSKGGEGG